MTSWSLYAESCPVGDNRFPVLESLGGKAGESARTRLKELEGVREALDLMPATAAPSSTLGPARDAGSLVTELLRRDRGQRVLYLPARAVLGRSWAIAEAQAWSALSKACVLTSAPAEECSTARDIAEACILGLMAEDAYQEIVDAERDKESRAAAAMRLIALWDSRPGRRLDEPGLSLAEVWASRRRNPPVFGTMLGTAEFMGLSLGVGGLWFDFVQEKMSEENIAGALEEFLFGLSWEEINMVKAHVEMEGPLGPADLESRLGIAGSSRALPEAATTDPRDLYRFYEMRRKLAAFRRQSGKPGPVATLEGEFLSWTLKHAAVEVS